MRSARAGVRLLAAAATLVCAVTLGSAGTLAAASMRPFDAHDLVALERVSDPRLSPDGRWVAYQLLETDLAGNRSVFSVWLAPVPDSGVPSSGRRFTRRLTAPGVLSYAPRWSRDGKLLFFLSTRSGSAQVWRLELAGGEAQAATHAPFDVGSFAVAPDGRHLVVSMRVFADCDSLECTAQRGGHR